MRRAAAAVLIATCAGPCLAQTPPRPWIGTITCDAMPGITSIPLFQHFEATVAGNDISFVRDIRVADTSKPSGGHEHAAGTIAGDGKIELHGQGLDPASAFRSDYSGTMAPDGRMAQLSGVQHWQFRSHAPLNRACQMTLQRPS